MLLDRLRQRVSQVKSKQLYRERTTFVCDPDNPNIINEYGCKLISFSSNDYLGLSHHPEIKRIAIEGVLKYGVGASASAFVTGYTEAHEAVEQAFASWLGVDRAVIFTSGYIANVGVLSAILNHHSLVYSDKLCHASLLDGVRLSRAKHLRYAHLSMSELSELCLIRKPDLIITESIFSMDGDLAPVDQLVLLAKKNKAELLIDDAHAIGVLGQYGRGAIDNFQLSQADFFCITIPLGKAFGVMGAVVAGRTDVIDTIIQLSGPCRYTTSLSPALCHALIHSLKIVSDARVLRDRLSDLVRYYIKKATFLGLRLCSDDMTPIKPILIGDVKLAMRLQQHLKDNGFYVHAMRPPTVPEHTARLRVSLNALHTEEMIDRMLRVVDSYIRSHDE